MALSPLLPEDELLSEDEAITAVEVEPSKTYSLNFESFKMNGYVDGTDALRQFVQKALFTARDRFLIYDDQYGHDIETLIGADVTDEFLYAEMPSLITEALIYDDRIDSVTDFVFSRKDDSVYVTFRVVGASGDVINEEVTL